ncbi:MAG: hypothetical protein LC799_36255, partial [Actinobacteria bacterium]|nr:hypothetical protein [Actinomycetota bacterium]
AARPLINAAAPDRCRARYPVLVLRGKFDPERPVEPQLPVLAADILDLAAVSQLVAHRRWWLAARIDRDSENPTSVRLR